MLMKILLVTAVTLILDVSGHKYGWMPTCNPNLFRLARKDVFKSNVTNDVREAHAHCKSTINGWTESTPCPDSCDEVMCLYNCALHTFVSPNDYEKFVKNYVQTGVSKQFDVSAVVQKCLVEANSTTDKYACSSKDYLFLNCIYTSFNGYKETTSGGGNVIIKQNSTNNQNANVGVNTGSGSTVNINVSQGAGSNQIANATVKGSTGTLIDQIAGIVQGIGVAAPSNSNVNANQGVKNNAAAIVKNIG